VPKIVINRFGGEAPKYHPSKLGESIASVAENVDLSAGTLKSFQKPELISTDKGQVVWREQCCVLASDNCKTTFAWMEADCGRMFATDFNGYDYPVTGELKEGCTIDWCRLGLPCELPAPTLSLTATSGHFVSEQRQYAYATVKKWGSHWEIGVLSELSDVINMSHSDVVTVSGIPSDFGEWCVDEVWIYRSASDLTRGEEGQSDGFYYVGAVSAGTTSFTDDVDEAGEIYRDEDFAAPESDLTDIHYLRNGQLAGLTGKYLAFSYKHHYHAWPQSMWMGFHSTPRRFISDGVTGFVLTDGRPAVVRIAQDCGEECHGMLEVRETHPVVSRRSAVVYAGHAIYASKDGLVMLSGNGVSRVITDSYYGQKEWRRIQPETMVSAIHDGHYYGFCENYAFRFRLPDDIYSKQDATALVTLTLRPIGMYRSENDELFLSFKNFTDVDGTVYDGTYRWDSAEDKMRWRWRSRLFGLDGKLTMNAYRLLFECPSVTTRFFKRSGGCLKLVKEKMLNDENLQRLPAGYSARGVMVEFESANSEVYEAVLATSAEESA